MWPSLRPAADERKPLTKKEIAADHPTWCPGCGDFSVLALYFKMIEKRKLWQEKFTTISGIGCSSRLPVFRPGLRRALHSWPLAALRQRHFALAARPARLRVRRRRRPLLHRRQPFHPHRAQERQADLRGDGQLGLWPDQETDLAHLAARLQEQDRHLGRGGLPDQPDEAGHRRGRHFRRADHAAPTRITCCR